MTTSFELKKGKITNPLSPCACYHDYLIYAQHLVPRKLTKKHKDVAKKLKLIYLGSLADELDISVKEENLENLLEADLRDDVALATYARELMRRSESASQGPGVYVIWKQLKNGLKSTASRVNVKAIIESEKAIVEKLRTMAE